MKRNLIFNFVVAVAVLALLCVTRRVGCITIVEMRFKEFENPGNKLMNGKCCDTNMKPIIGCFFECEHFFEISARPYPGNKTTLSYIKTYVLSNGNTTFTDGMQLNRRQKNPWIFIYEKPYVSFVSINIVFFF